MHTGGEIHRTEPALKKACSRPTSKSKAAKVTYKKSIASHHKGQPLDSHEKVIKTRITK